MHAERMKEMLSSCPSGLKAASVATENLCREVQNASSTLRAVHNFLNLSWVRYSKDIPKDVVVVEDSLGSVLARVLLPMVNWT